MRHRIVLALCTTALSAAALVERPSAAREAETPRVAITIDDVPWAGAPVPAAEMLAATERMIAALHAHRAPVAVLVTCGRLQQPRDPILERWIASGATVGNHTTSHRDLNSAPLAEWLADVRSCDATLRAATGRPVRYFRFPMLHEGRTTEQQRAARRLLRELDYRNAHVTIDNSDYRLVRLHRDLAARGDEEGARVIVETALAHDLDAARHFQQVARAKLGRDVPHILLLHANLMTAAMMAPLLDSLERRGFRFVSLGEALADPVFGKPSCYTGPRGFSFLYRIAPCTDAPDGWDQRAEQALLARFPDAAR